MNICNIYLFGKLMDGLIRVLVGKRVHIYFDSCGSAEVGVDRKRGMKQRNAEEGEKNELCNCIHYVRVFGKVYKTCETESDRKKNSTSRAL